MSIYTYCQWDVRPGASGPYTCTNKFQLMSMGAEGWSSVPRPGSEDPKQRQQIFFIMTCDKVHCFKIIRGLDHHSSLAEIIDYKK